MTAYRHTNNNNNKTDLVFSDGLYQDTVDNVDDDAQKQNDGILAHSSAERISTALISPQVAQ